MTRLTLPEKKLRESRRKAKYSNKVKNQQSQAIRLFITTGEITPYHPLHNKLSRFLERPATKEDYQLFLEKFGKLPTCYLTGEKINLNNTSSYHLDHVYPKSRGGSNSFENMQIATKQANLAKNDMTVEEFKELCRKIISY